jgi:hypothetical protein
MVGYKNPNLTKKQRIKKSRYDEIVNFYALLQWDMHANYSIQEFK